MSKETFNETVKVINTDQVDVTLTVEQKDGINLQTYNEVNAEDIEGLEELIQEYIDGNVTDYAETGVDIVSLEANGEKVYIEAHADGVVGLDAKLNGVKVTDSGWQNPEIFVGNPFVAHVHEAVQCRRVGDVVYIVGVLEHPSGTSSYDFGQLPSGFFRNGGLMFLSIAASPTDNALSAEPAYLRINGEGVMRYMGTPNRRTYLNVSFIL
jgi:hypothetical protein